MRAPIRRRRLAAAALAASLAVAAAPALGGEADAFRTVANFNVPGGGVAEIVDASPDGRTLFYTDAGGKAVGVVDISDPAAPSQVARIPVPGEPTSVAFTADGSRALVAVNTSVKEEGEPPQITPGLLLVIDVASRAVVDQVAIGNGPDSVATARIAGRDVAVVAIENEPVVVDEDGNLTDGEDPGDPGDISGPGLVQVVVFEAGGPRVVDVPLDLSGVEGALFRDDPQPEFAAIRGTSAAVSVQENNAIAVIDLAAAMAGQGNPLERIFSIGVAGDRPADLADDNRISFSDRYPSDVDRAEHPDAGVRTPDALAWSPDGKVIYSADEGEQDFTGGRGWSAHDARTGKLVWEDTDLERIAARFGQYPDSRSEAKGIEVEGLEVARIAGRDLAFVGSERGSFLAVYDISNRSRPRFVQLLPTGVEPEGVLAIPSRKLVVASAEATGDLAIFRGVDGKPGGTPERPQVGSRVDGEGWAALSGVAGDPEHPNVLWSVPDNALVSALYRIELKGGNATLTQRPITEDGEQATYDLEGIAVDTSIAAHGRGLERAKAARGKHGFWLAHEGNAAFGDEDYSPNLLIEVGWDGKVIQEVPLPPAVDSPTGGQVRSNGFEGVAVSDSGRYLLAAVQREYASDKAVGGVLHTRIARYDLLAKRWDFFLYPLESTDVEDDWVGLSEMVNLGGDRYAVIERDKLLGGAARIKRVYEFTLDGLTPTDGSPVAADADLTNKVIQKTLLRDVLAQSAPFEKLEGLAITSKRQLWGAIDNDGGLHESRLIALGEVSEGVDLWLSLLHNNDGESKLLGTETAGGVARFSTLVSLLRGQAGRFGAGGPRAGSVMISSGDNFLAGPEFNASLDRGTVPFFDSIAHDRIGYDAMAIGNHEFDFGPDVLADVIRGTRRTGPWLSANIDVSPVPSLDHLARSGRIAASTVVNVDGRRVGVVGATTPLITSISSPGAVRVGEVAPAVQAEVDALRAKGVGIIVLSSHLQSIEEDVGLAPLLRGVDVMIAGGGDELLANPDDLLQAGDPAPGTVPRPYPVIATDADGKRLPVVTTAGDYRYVGRLIAGFDRDGNLVRIDEESGPVRVVGGDAPDAVAPDAFLLERVVAPVQAAVDALAANRIADTEVHLDGRRGPGIRTQETNLGSLAADSLLFEGRRAATALGLPAPAIAFQNGGGIRNNNVFPDDLAKGVTELDTFAVLPFSNFVAVMPELTRAKLKEVLENAVSRVEQVDGRFAQIAGFRFTWDASRPVGSRVTEVVLDSGETIVSGGALVDGPALSVATLDFLANGGDQYPLVGVPFQRSTVTYQQALLNYIVAPTAEGGLGGRVTAAQYPEIPSPGNGTRITRLN